MMAQLKAAHRDGDEAAGKVFAMQAIEALMAVLMDGMPEDLKDADAAPEDDDGKKSPAS
jgi:hypothetical protein